MRKLSKLLFQSILTAVIIHSCVFAAEDGTYEIKSLSVKDSLASVVIDTSNRMQVSSINGKASLETVGSKIILTYSATLSGIFLANPNLLQYSNISGEYTLNNPDDCVYENDNSTVVKCRTPIEKNRTLYLNMEKMSDKR